MFSLESPGEMALIAKASRQRNLHDWFRRSRQFVTGVFDAEFAHVIADGAVKRLVKCLGQVDRMHAHILRDFGQRKIFREARVEQIFLLLKPARRAGASSRFRTSDPRPRGAPARVRPRSPARARASRATRSG